jgi:RimJ/RimL family protein N-acetyltransferase
MQLVRPGPEHLPQCVAALQNGWSPDNIRAAAAQEALARIEADAAGYLALTHNPQGGGEPVKLPDGSVRERLPSFTRWMWVDDGGVRAAGAGGGDIESVPPFAPNFAGVMNLRWPADLGALPPHVLGHIGYSVVPWKRQRGHATRALALLLPLAREVGLPFVELTTDPDNIPSQRVITANGGVLVETFVKDAVWGGKPGLRYRIDL